jgi:hypothetical protein
VVEISLTRQQVVLRVFTEQPQRFTITDASFDGNHVHYAITIDGRPSALPPWDIPGIMSGLNVTKGTLKSVCLDGDYVRYRFE